VINHLHNAHLSVQLSMTTYKKSYAMKALQVRHIQN